MLQRDGHDDDVSRFRRVEHGCRACLGSELANQIPQGVGAARVAEHDVMPVRNREAGDLAADVTSSDESYRRHGGPP
jgi:hypothetical protein